jgi:hypothetical protein
LKRLQIILVGAIALGGTIAALRILHHARVSFRENALVLGQQTRQLAELSAECRRLSDLLAATNDSSTNTQMVELLRLRSTAAGLRTQVSALAKQVPQTSRATVNFAVPAPLRPNKDFPGSVVVISDSNSKEYEAQLYNMALNRDHPTMGDARNLSYAVRAYSRAHDGEFPGSFDQAASYAYKSDIPLAGTRKGRDPMAGVDQFDLVYQGSLNDVTNIPINAVALMRERVAWPTPAGKWAKLYGMLAGRVVVVESDDNFQSWEAAHLIPPASQ